MKLLVSEGKTASLFKSDWSSILVIGRHLVEVSRICHLLFLENIYSHSSGYLEVALFGILFTLHL